MSMGQYAEKREVYSTLPFDIWDGKINLDGIKNSLIFAVIKSPTKFFIMLITKLQIFVFIQSLVWKINHPEMELTRMAVPFRSEYKRSRGLSRNADAVTILKDVRLMCNENDMLTEFFRATRNHPEVIKRLA